MKNPAYLLARYCFLLICAFTLSNGLAHNGSVALAYPVSNIRIDGDLADWLGITRYPIALTPSDVKPHNNSDFSGYFMIGYNLGDHSLYVGIEVTDDDYKSDTSKSVSWNTQDALAIYLDARHLTGGSGVAAYHYSETYKHIDSNKWDVAAGVASWEHAEVNMKRYGSKVVYEWKISMGEYIKPGGVIGFDLFAFDKDNDGFGWTGWGAGDRKYQNSNALGDVILMNEKEGAGTLNGIVKLTNSNQSKMSVRLKITNTRNQQTSIMASADSLGNYSVPLPAGKYNIALADHYMPDGNKVYVISGTSTADVDVKANKKVTAPAINARMEEAPDLIPAKGLLQTFGSGSAGEIDKFVETYRMYYQIPGVSLALIKDGKVVYHKVYGVTNSFTNVPVNDSTLFEAASITKPIFSYAVQRLAERGVIDLDKPLYEYLPFKDIEYDDRYKLITGRHVLTHRTGFPNWRDGKLVINFTPGTQYSYSGEGMQYLQAVVEKITGKGIEQVLKEEVLDPLAMHHTFFSKNDRLMRLVATGHFDNVPSSDDPPDSPGMAFSMHTEALEFSKFIIQLLEQKGLSPVTYANMLSERSPYTYKDDEEKPKYKAYMGESLDVSDSPFGQSFGHGGNNGDFRCDFRVYKDSKMGYVVFTNSSTAYPFIAKMKSFFVEGKE